MEMKFYSLEEVAELFGVTYQSVYKLVTTGELSSVRIGKVYRISDAQLKNYMDKQSTGTPASGTQAVICSCCGRTYYSQMSIAGTCRDCGAAICRSCVENDHAEYCEIHKNNHTNNLEKVAK